jgi:hypothetical protein
MSKKAADHHRKASEHHEKAALHHAEAAKHHMTNAFERAAHHAYLAQAHQHHATHHAGEALQAHLNDHGSRMSAEPAGSTGGSVSGAGMDVKATDSRSSLTAPGEVKKAKMDVAADKINGATGKAAQNPKDAAKKTGEVKNTGEKIKKHNR